MIIKKKKKRELNNLKKKVIMMWSDLNRSTKSQKFWFYIDIWIIII